MARLEVDDHFRQFAQNLEQVLDRHGTVHDGTLLAHQRDQIRKLVELETKLRQTLITHPWGPGVYRDFVKYICDKRRNILAARPFFRERQTIFTRHISKALKARNDKALYRFRFNWSLVEFILASRKWPSGGKVAVLAREISRLRSDLLEQNLPLAISQARIFWANTPRSHLTYMDIIQIQCQGLLLAIDKFVPPNDKRMSNRASLEAYRKFRAVAIGIMARDRVNAYSETLVHFYPGDKAKMYQALKFLRRNAGEVDHEAAAVHVNNRLADRRYRTDGQELAGLLAAGSTVSADYTSEPDGETVADTFPDSESNRPDLMVEEADASTVLRDSVRGLDLRDQKMVKMKGVRF